MAVKKKVVSKKKAVEFKALPFNKENAKRFADTIYLDKNGIVSFLKLCKGTLKNGKDGGRTLRCAVGEAYHTFVNPNMKRVCSISEYDSEFSIRVEGETAKAIQELVDAAQLKKNDHKHRLDLAQALDACVDSNDTGNGDKGIGSVAERSEAVAYTWRTSVVPLLK